VGELAARVGAPVVITGDGYGALTEDHPLYVGVLTLGAFGRDPFPASIFRKADAVLAVGLRVGTPQAEAITGAAPDGYVFIGFDGESNLPARAAAAQVCDNRLFLRALLRELAGFRRDPDPALVELIRRYRQTLQAGLAAELENYRQARPIHFGLAVKELFDRLDEDAIVVTDVGVHNVWANQLARIRRPDSLQAVGRWAEMGFALPGAIAAKLVYPNRQVVGVTGDGCFLMSDNDFATAVQERANILLIIMNDSQYGMIYKMQRDRFERAYASELYTPNFARYAEAFGAAGFRVEDPADLPAVIDRALKASREVPTIVDVASGYTYPYPPVDRIVAGLLD
jgi:thiamine pyrophosphate-dependent acetolactate synthase large subunit-like protein